MPEEERVDVMPEQEVGVETEGREQVDNKSELSIAIEQLQDLVAEIVDVVDKIAEVVNSMKSVKEEMEETVKGTAKEIIELIKAELTKPGEADKKREDEWASNVPEGKEPAPSEKGEEVNISSELLNELAPKPQEVAKAATPRVTDVQKGVVSEDVDLVTKILKGEIRGVADLVRYMKR